MRLRIPFAQGCERELIGAALALLLAILLARTFPGILAYLLFVVAAIVLVVFLVFFRDPERVPPNDQSLLLSPADGRVVAIQDVDDPHIGAATRISIFLSLFDVHVNRSPFNAQVLSTKHYDGQFHHAASADASEVNERNEILLQAGERQIVVKQIAGLVARRIVCWKKPGDTLERGERFGLIKFGSRVDVILPRGTQILVHMDDVVRGGKTAFAKLS
jgi:phosphatidylserine decarboxylase